jgi:hypothetical protein
VRRLWLRCAVDLDDVAVGIKREELGETGPRGAPSTSNKTSHLL